MQTCSDNIGHNRDTIDTIENYCQTGIVKHSEYLTNKII